MTTQIYTDERRWANTDPSLHHNTVEAQPSREWFGEMIECLKRGDYESAELIRSRNVPQSDECAAGDHDLCEFRWCKCSHHSAVQFEMEHKPLKSLVEIQSERDEQEAA